MSSRARDLAIGAALVAGVAALLAATAGSLGFTRDEGYYFKAAESYWGWFATLFSSLRQGAPWVAFAPDTIDKYWGYNHEHPAGVKTLFAFGFGLQQLTGFPAHISDAIRLPAWLLSGVSTACVYGLSRCFLRVRASLLAALLWLGMPHVFWHMHVACFDIAIAAGHTWLVWAYWRGRHSLRGALWCGVAFALAATMKHNVLPVPALLVLHWLLCNARWPTQEGAVTGAAAAVVLPRVPLAFFAMALLSPALYLLHWPWLWPDPLRRFGAYLSFHLRHEHYPILYFGDLLTHPPFPVSFPFVMSAVTIPVPTAALMLLGFMLAFAVGVRFLRTRWTSRSVDSEVTRVPLGDVGREPSGSAALLLVLNAFFPFFLIALPSTPIFGGTKHWLNGLPFLCVLAAWVFEEGLARAQALGWVRHRVVPVLVALLLLAPGPVISARVWPFGLGSYNELIGFARGAANVGMQRTFWGYEPRPALPLVNARAPRNARIHFGDTNNDDFRMYRRDGLLRQDISVSGTVDAAQVASVQPQGEFKQQWLDVWNEWGDRTPDVVLHAEGVPVCTVTFKENP